MAYLFSGGKFREVDANGAPLAGGLLYTYAAGTLTPLATYTDAGGASPNTNPVVLDASGRANVFLGALAYRMILKTSTGSTIWDEDNISDPSIGAQANVLALLADQTTATKGAGLVGYGANLAYAVGTVGNELNLLNATGKPALVQKLLATLDAGYDNGIGTNTELFAGAGAAAQGLTIVTPIASVNAVKSFVTLQRVSGSSYKINERQRLVQWPYVETGGTVAPLGWSNIIQVGHESLSDCTENGSTVFYSGYQTQAAHEDTDAGKGFTRIIVPPAGIAAIGPANVTNYQLWGYTGSGHKFAAFYHSVPCVSPSGKYLVVGGHQAQNSAGPSTSNDYVFIYDKAQVLAAADPLTVDPLNFFQVNPVPTPNGDVIQDVHCDDTYIYILLGLVNPFGAEKGWQKFTMNGDFLGFVALDGPRGLYGLSGMLNNSTLGNPVDVEFEGMTTNDNGDKAFIAMDWWKIGGDICLWNTENWCSIATTNIGNYPYQGGYWVKTTKAVTQPAWQGAGIVAGSFLVGGVYRIVTVGTTDFTLIGAASNTIGVQFTATGVGVGTGTADRYFTSGVHYTRKAKLVYAVRAGTGVGGVPAAGEQPINGGIAQQIQGGNLPSGPTAIDITFNRGDSLQACAYDPSQNRYYTAWALTGSNKFSVYDFNDGSDSTKVSSFGSVFTLTGSTREITTIRCNGSSGGINVYGSLDALFANQFRYLNPDGSSLVVFDPATNSVRPGTSSLQTLGTTSIFWAAAFARFLQIGSVGAGVGISIKAGTGAPSSTEPQGSIYFRTDTTTTANQRIYINTNGTNTWTALV